MIIHLLTADEVVSKCVLGAFGWSELIATFGFIAGIITFICQMSKSRTQNLNNQKETWYLEIIVKPNIDAINKFYFDYISKLTEVITELKCLENSKTAGEIRQLKRDKINDILMFTSKETDYIISLVRSYNGKLGTAVSDNINNLVDASTKIINQYINYNENDIRKAVLDNKEVLIYILNKGLSTD